MNLQKYFNLLVSSRKPLTFALAGALGCLAASLIGEIWLLAAGGLTAPVNPPRPAVVFLIDCSGSMSDSTGQALPSKIEQVKESAKRLSHDLLPHADVGVVAFNNTSWIATQPTPLTPYPYVVDSALDTLGAGGMTEMQLGLDQTVIALLAAKGPKVVVIFTDGGADDPASAALSARRLLDAGVSVIAVGTADAPADYLAQLTGDPSRVLDTSSTGIPLAFEHAGTLAKTLIGSSAGRGGSVASLFQVSLWTALLAMGLAAALVAAQNHYLKRPLFDPVQIRSGIVGALLAGLTAGAAGSVLYSLFGNGHPVIDFVCRVLGWTLLGFLLGTGLSRVVPNFPANRAMLGGALGGMAGSICAGIFALVFGATIGRIFGGAVIGLCVGLMIAVVETMMTQAWLEIAWSSTDRRRLPLGERFTRVGSNREICAVYTANQPPELLRYRFIDGKVLLEDATNGRIAELHDGDRRQVGSIVLSVMYGGQNQATSVTTPQRQATVPFRLHVGTRQVALTLGQQLHRQDLHELKGGKPNVPVAEVSQHPADRSILGLRNLSDSIWQVRTSTGMVRQVPIGQSVRLERGTGIVIENLPITVI